MPYIQNITDKQQTDIERAADDSAIRFPWFDGKQQQVGVMRSIKAYDLAAQAPSQNGASDDVRIVPGSGSVIGSHNDHPHRFDTPGKV